ncbi:MAG: hypothetical protein DRQ55_17865, partial [Planctomycetota bacterium]
EGFAHLGDDPTPEWSEAPEQPRAAPLVIRFEAARNADEQVLSLLQRNVNDDWSVLLNGVAIASLARHEGVQRQHYAVPADALRDGANELLFRCATTTDDVTLGDIRLHAASLAQVLDLVELSVAVHDPDGRPVPARITLLDGAGALLTVRGVSGPATAVREGLVYTDGSATALLLPRGETVLHASHGTEWSHVERSVRAGVDASVTLTLRRELDTRGWIAADTHIHTVTISGHGDSTLEERMITLAAEGVELAVASDHNHNVDYRPFQLDAGLEAWFTPVVGNEVTTPHGHFNAFPLDADDEVPLHDSTDWVALVNDMRAKGARAVILNHPRWPAFDTGPFGRFGLDQATGQRRATGTAFLFDAMELVNSTTDTVEPMVLFRDWFALLNRGERIFAVGSSDSHTVGDPVGRGRTYVRSDSDDPAALDAEALAMNIADGHSSVSLGLLIDVRSEGRSAMGHTVLVDDQVVDLSVRVAAPSWARPERLALWVNGELVLERELAPPPGQPYDVTLPLALDLPHLHDAWVVVAVFGPDAGGAWWPGSNEYTLACSNPVFLDVDGDGVWRSPREVAQARWKGAPNSMDLVDVDDAVALQYLELADAFYERQARQRLSQLADGFARRSAAIKAWLEQRSAESEGR